MDLLVDEKIRAAIAPLVSQIATLQDQVRSLTSEVQSLRSHGINEHHKQREIGFISSQAQPLECNGKCPESKIAINADEIPLKIDQVVNTNHQEEKDPNFHNGNTDSLGINNQHITKTEESIEQEDHINIHPPKESQKKETAQGVPQKNQKGVKGQAQAKAKVVPIKQHEKFQKMIKKKQQIEKSSLLKVEEPKQRKISEGGQKVIRSAVIQKQKVQVSKGPQRHTKEPIQKEKSLLKSTQTTIKKSNPIKQGLIKSEKKNQDNKGKHPSPNQEAEECLQKHTKEKEQKQLNIINIDEIREYTTGLIARVDKIIENVPQGTTKIGKEQYEHLLKDVSELQGSNISQVKKVIEQIINKLMVSSELAEAKTRIQLLFDFLTYLICLSISDLNTEKPVQVENEGIQIGYNLETVLIKLREMTNLMSADWRDLLSEDFKMIKLSINLLGEPAIMKENFLASEQQKVQLPKQVNEAPTA